MVLAIDFRNQFVLKFQHRNSTENDPFADLIKSYNKVFDLYNTARLNESKVAVQKNQDANESPSNTRANSSLLEKIQQLERELLKSKDEVIDLQKKLVEQSQQVILLNKQLKEKNDELSVKEAKNLECENRAELLRNQVKDLENKVANYEEAAKLWHDEKVEAEMQYNCLLQKHDKLKEDYQQILSASLRFREEQIDRINKQNELETERFKIKLKEELANASLATSDIIHSAPINIKPQINSAVQLVSKVCYKFDCNEGEVNAVKFHKSGKFFLTGGGDRKIKIWEYKDGKAETSGSLIGSNASIASIDIDHENNLVAGTSFDFACRLWALNDNRLRMSSGDLQPTHTLTGHTNKVLTGKFLGIMKVVTGSYDRTLKVWDLVQKACIKTLFAGSSCNDAVAMDSSCVISGHLDKKIRFWDIRSDATQSEILLQGKVASLDVSPNRNYLLANVRDVNALKLIDIRMNQVVETFCCDEYKPSCDWSKAIFSPDYEQQYVCAGSTDGGVVIWNTNTAKVEKILKEHSSPVLSLAWHPQGNYLVSCDSKKRAVLWV